MDLWRDQKMVAPIREKISIPIEKFLQRKDSYV